jgi:hypothetical protein
MLVAGGVVLFWRGLLILAAAVALIAVAAYIGHVWRRWQAVHRFGAVWQSRGKDLLLVYSNSQIGSSMLKRNGCRATGDRAVVLNWSERQNWQSERRPEVVLFRTFAGVREFNPLCIVVPRKGRAARVIRFWRVFEYNHGKDRSLRMAEAELEACLNSTVQ